MDCCGFGAAAWAGYAAQRHAAAYYAHDPYRPYRPPYAAHHHRPDPLLPLDYGAYAAKEVRARRALARRDRVHPPHLTLPPTPPLEASMGGRGPLYEPQMWPHYQMGMMNGGWNGAHHGWARGACARDMRYPVNCRQMKGPLMPQCYQEGRSTPYPGYEDVAPYSEELRLEGRHAAPGPEARAPPRPAPEPRRAPPEDRPPVVPLPAFQQAFGSTEIGRFSEAFTRAEPAHEAPAEAEFAYEPFAEWEGAAEPWAAREIKCEDNY